MTDHEPPTDYAARYGEGVNATRVAAALRMEAGGLLVTPENGGPILWAYADLRTAEPIRARSVDAVLTSRAAKRASLYVDDALFLAHLIKRAPGLKLNTERWRTGRPGLAVGAVALMSCAGIWAFDVSPTKGLARTMPEKARMALGDSVIRTMPAQRRCTAVEGRAALAKLMQRLMPNGPITADSITVLDWSLLNAFAVPGNRIVLTRGLIEQAQSPDEIAAVIGHEAGHSIELHPEASLVRSVGFWALVQMVFTGTPGAIGNIGVVLAQLGYTRSAEREADGHALRLLQEARISPKGMGNFFRRMDKRTPTPKAADGNSVGDILSTHPSNPERIARIDGQRAYEATPALADEEWRALKAICVNAVTAPPLAKPGTAPAQSSPETAGKQSAPDAQRAAATAAARAEAAAKTAAAKADAENSAAVKAEAARSTAAKADAEKATAAKAESDRIEAAKTEAANRAAALQDTQRAQAAKDAADRTAKAAIEAAWGEAAKIEAARLEAEKAEGVRMEAAAKAVDAAKVDATKTDVAKTEADKTEGETATGKQTVAMAAGVPGPLTAAPRTAAAQTPLDVRISAASKRIAANATDTGALIERGQAFAAKQDAVAAIEDFSRVLAIRPADANTLFWRASMLAQRGMLDLAISDYNDVIKLQPKNFAAFNNRGSLYRSQKKLDLALRDYTAAIAIDGKQAIALTNRALIHRERSELDTALIDLNAAIAANASYANAYVRRGETHELKSAREAAIADYRAVLRLPEAAGTASEPHATARTRLTALGVKF